MRLNFYVLAMGLCFLLSCSTPRKKKIYSITNREDLQVIYQQAGENCSLACNDRVEIVAINKNSSRPITVKVQKKYKYHSTEKDKGIYSFDLKPGEEMLLDCGCREKLSSAKDYYLDLTIVSVHTNQ